MEDYRVIKKLDSGGQGVTHETFRKSDNKTVVINRISCVGFEDVNDSLKETKGLQCLSNPDVVKFEDFFLDGKKLGKKFGVYIVQIEPGSKKKKMSL